MLYMAPLLRMAGIIPMYTLTGLRFENAAYYPIRQYTSKVSAKALNAFEEVIIFVVMLSAIAAQFIWFKALRRKNPL